MIFGMLWKFVNVEKLSSRSHTSFIKTMQNCQTTKKRGKLGKRPGKSIIINLAAWKYLDSEMDFLNPSFSFTATIGKFNIICDQYIFLPGEQ